jgi:hypothetical protein
MSKGGGDIDKTLFVATYDPEVTYAINNWCTFAGKIYKSLQNSNVNKSPASQPAFWEELSTGGGGGVVEKQYGTGTINTTSWVANASTLFPYKLDYAISGIVDATQVFVTFDNEKLAVSYTAGLVSGTTYDGGITFYAVNIPTASIDFSYVSF